MHELRIGIVGAGHFGRFHAFKVLSSPRSTLIGICDRDPARALAVGREVDAPVLSWPDLLSRCDAVVVATPAESHFAYASAALRAGRHVLVEKPMASTLQEANELAELAGTSGRVFQVGHLLRYSAEHEAISSRMQRPLYIECVRVAPFKARGTDVSVVLDLMIHDIDLILSLVESPIAAVDAVGATVASEHEDIANARIHFANGCVATITASRISLKTERKMRLFSQEGYMSVDFVARKLVMIGRKKGLPLPGTGGGRLEELSWEEHDSMAAEHAAFAASILDNAPVIVNAAAGQRALEAALAVSESVQANRARAEASGLIHP